MKADQYAKVSASKQYQSLSRDLMKYLDECN